MNPSLIRQKLFFFLVDILLVMLAFLLAYYFRLWSFYRSDFPFFPYLLTALITAPIWMLFLAWGGKYALREQSHLEVLRSTSLSAIAGAMLFVLIFFFRREIFFSRLIVTYIFCFGTLFTLGSHILEKKWQAWKVRKGKDIFRVLCIGTNRSAEEIIARLKVSSSQHVPVALLSPFGGSVKEILGVPVLGKLNELENVVDTHHIHEIILCDGSEQMMNLLSFAEGRFLNFRVSPEIFGVYRENIHPEILAGKTLLTLKHSPLFGWGQFWKRGFDVFFSALLLIPVSILFLFQKIFRGGFVSEKRIGAGGREFWMYRFSKIKANSFWRDLPNLLNIFHGEMSFVGPRPALPDEWASLAPHYKRRMTLRPGMLGRWQIRKLHGEADNFEKMFAEDMEYILRWSFWGDVRIILQSIWAARERRKSLVGSFSKSVDENQIEANFHHTPRHSDRRNSASER
ncbi:sugar transferase [Candidatus Peregrinibacteria bacterium]|nr:sugar transferase [Candidatus Peregrinibacteria bacterium]